MKLLQITNLPLRETMCATCPFKAGSPYADLAPMLALSSLSDASRICHSTGANGIHKRTGKEPHLCRGARNVQLEAMFALGVIEAATDEAWNKERVNCGMTLTVTKNP